MTKSSSGAKCKVLQVQVRVEVAPALSGRESVGGRALWVERAGVPRKLQLQELQELPPFSCILAPPLEALPLFRPEAPEAPGACGVRYDSNLRQHDRKSL